MGLMESDEEIQLLIEILQRTDLSKVDEMIEDSHVLPPYQTLKSNILIELLEKTLGLSFDQGEGYKIIVEEIRRRVGLVHFHGTNSYHLEGILQRGLVGDEQGVPHETIQAIHQECRRILYSCSPFQFVGVDIGENRVHTTSCGIEAVDYALLSPEWFMELCHYCSMGTHLHHNATEKDKRITLTRIQTAFNRVMEEWKDRGISDETVQKTRKLFERFSQHYLGAQAVVLEMRTAAPLKEIKAIVCETASATRENMDLLFCTRSEYEWTEKTCAVWGRENLRPERFRIYEL